MYINLSNNEKRQNDVINTVKESEKMNERRVITRPAFVKSQ